MRLQNTGQRIQWQRYAHLTFDKESKTTLWRKSQLDKQCWQNWISSYRRMKLNSYLPPCTKINSKWIKDLNLKMKALKLTAQDLRASINSWNYIKMKYPCTGKETINRENRQSSEQEKISTSYTSDKRLPSRIYKELQK